MNTRIIATRARGFTLIELLVVIAIIGILAGLLLPALGRVKTNARIRQARLEMAGIVAAIKQYESHYSRWPVTTGTMNLVPPNSDLTLGNGNAPAFNREIITILMDRDDATYNPGHARNPQRHVLLTPKPATANNPGVDPAGVYRDPWGNPYIITIDLNLDEKCRDPFHRMRTVSQSSGQTGHNGLINSTDAGGNGDNFELSGPVMVWSAGPDRQINAGLPAKTGVNKDNVLSWTE